MASDAVEAGPSAPATEGFANPRRLLIGIALASVWFFGGTNYIAIAFGLDGFPPFAMLALRFLGAGVLLALVTVLVSRPRLTWRTAMHAASVGLVLTGGSFIGIGLAQQTLGAGLVAALVATAPLWAALVAALLGKPPALLEWAGIAFGIGGLALLAIDGSVQATPEGALYAIAGAACMAIGSTMAQRLPLPGLLPSSAIQMLTAGTMFLLLSRIVGEEWPAHVEMTDWLVIAYQAVFCSAVAFGMYNYLLANVRVTVAMSFAYVNPVVAVVLGALLLSEHVDLLRIVAIAVTLVGVVIITNGRRSNLNE